MYDILFYVVYGKIRLMIKKYLFILWNFFEKNCIILVLLVEILFVNNKFWFNFLVCNIIKLFYFYWFLVCKM